MCCNVTHSSKTNIKGLEVLPIVVEFMSYELHAILCGGVTKVFGGVTNVFGGVTKVFVGVFDK